MAVVGRRKKIWRRGTTTVETAIVFPLLLLVTLGAIQYGWLFLKAQQITNAARHGARIAILPGVTVLDDVEPAILALMSLAGIDAGDYSVMVTPAILPDVGPGEAVTVRITVPTANITIMETALLPTPTNLTGEVTMAKEGPMSIIP